MSLTGNAEGKVLRGTINKLTELRGYSAYEVALLNGFSGTEEEWLDSLRADVFSEEEKKELVKEVADSVTLESLGLDGIEEDVASKVSKSGDTMTGSLNMSGNRVLNVGTPTESADAANKQYVDTVTDGATNRANEYADTKATETKGYVDTNIAEAKGYAATFAKKVSNPRNLLDNSDFSRPVNQRGIADGAVINNAYLIDRWKLANVGTVTFGDGFITISANKGYPAYLRQHLESPVKFPCTFVVHTLDGVLTCVFNGYNERIDFDNGVGIQNNAENRWDVIIPQDTSVSIENVALYSGEYTADDLPDYQSKGYGAELAECQRYYIQSWDGATIGANGVLARAAIAPNRLHAVDFPVTMRATPTIKFFTTNGEEGKVKEWVSSTVVEAVLHAGYPSTQRFIPTFVTDVLDTTKVYSFHYSASADL